MTLLPAAAEGFQSVRRYLAHGTPGGGNSLLFLGFGAIAALWVGLYLWDRRKRRSGVRIVGTGLFDELCRAHRLSPEERSVLRRAVADRQPAVGFVEPEHLRRHAATHDADAAACAALSERLFGPGGHAGRSEAGSPY